MKQIYLIIYTILIVVSISANDAFVTIAGGQINLSEYNKFISIQKEDLIIEIKDDFYTVNINYKFYNNGKTIKLKTAFPQYKTYISESENYKVNNFKIEYGDGRSIDYSFDPTLTKLNDRQYIDGWFIKEIEFVGSGITDIHISYDSIYGSYAGANRATYLLGTGKSWLGPIGQLNLTVINNSKNWIQRLLLDNISNYKYTNVTDGIYSLDIGQHEPSLLDEIDIIIQENPTYSDAQISFLDSYWLDNFKIKTSNLRYLNSKQLRILRNAIYANKGYKFKSDDLNNFFSEKYWYEIDDNFTESMLNEIEKYNIRSIYNYEYLQREKKLVNIEIKE